MTDWTKEQEQAITERGGRLLVSASAGSGKTAVLVARIISRILDAEDPLSVDEMLIMTFTRAAAAEMRKRVRDALLAARRTDQLAIIDSASIQTIDSFCMNVVKEYPDEIGIDPGARIADEAELKLLYADILEEMLESCFESAEEEFLRFVESYTTGNAARGLEDIILNLYRFAQSNPDPERWYEEQLEGGNDYYEYPYRVLREDLQRVYELMQEAAELCEAESGPEPYAPTIRRETEQLEKLLDADSFEELKLCLSGCEFQRLKSASGDQYDPLLVERVKAIRDYQKKKLITLREMLSAVDINTGTRMAITLVREFDRRVTERKREKNILDFNDVEHLTLRLFKEHPETAEEYGRKFREIYVDEYQDTSSLQEQIVAALDRGEVFMVGDVKQSIYKFRQARPEIFAEKYQRFSEGNGGKLIELNRNFRSSPEVLDGINGLFAPLMPYYQPMLTDQKNGHGVRPEILLAASDPADGLSAEEAEACAIAAQIRKLKEKQPSLKYSDIVLLLRSANTIGDIYRKILNQEGIPAYCETKKGYFDSPEIRTMIAFLTVIDNPLKDIPMAAFLRSPIVGMDDNDLVRIAGKRRKQFVYDRLCASTDPLAQKAVALLEHYAALSRWMSISELIGSIYDETGYYAYASALTPGNTRRANLDKLKHMADSFAQTGYRGLFHFLRYIDNLNSSDSDPGEAGNVSENDDVVRIMSIHASKGLQFPTVFVGALARRINQKDASGSILADADLGIACRFVEYEKRVRMATLKQNIIRYKMRRETIEEELRIFYVAMTRAQERLILVCDEDGYRKSLAKPKISMDAASFIDWVTVTGVLPCETVTVPEKNQPEAAAVQPEKNQPEEITAEVTGKRQGGENGEQDAEKTTAEAGPVSGENENPEDSEAAAEDLRRLLWYRYPFAADVNLRNKISVSELKRKWQIAEEGADGDGGMFTGGEKSALWKMDSGEQTSQGNTAAETAAARSSSRGASERGTMYHSVMEHLDYADFDAYYNTLDDDIRAVVKKSDIETFLSSELGEKCRTAAMEGQLYRERQFLMGLSAREIGEADSGEEVLIQGIIDAFIDGEELILIDYKTDRVTTAEELCERYRVQLHYYALALEKLRGRKPDRQILWSFALGRAVEIRDDSFP